MKKYVVLLSALLLVMSVAVCATQEQTPIVKPSDIAGKAFLAEPDQEVTAEQLITVAARLHSVYNGGEISENCTVDEYKSYALENNIIFEELFDDMEKSVSRAELAYVFGNIIPEGELRNINGVLAMPDSDVTSMYYQSALSLINAGVVEGIDKYGSFGPTRAIRRYELNEIITRLVNDGERLEDKYIQYGADEPFYLIDDYLMGDTTSVRGIYNIASGWRYDYTGSSEKAYLNVDSTEGARNGYVNTLRDLSTEEEMSISREIFPQQDGKIVLETSFHITMGFAGLRLYFQDIEGNDIFEMGTYSSGLYFYDDSYYNYGSYRKTRYISYPYSGEYRNDRKFKLYADPYRTKDSADSQYRISDQIRARLTFDLDMGTVNVNISSTDYGTYSLNTKRKAMEKVVFATGIPEQIEYTVKQVHLYKNYQVNDKMRVDKVNDSPSGYEITGEVYVEEMYTTSYNQGDFYSARVYGYADEHNCAYKKFDEVSGKVQLEAYLLIPTGDDGIYFQVGYDKNVILKVVTSDEKFFIENKDGTLGQELRFFTPDVWQCIRIEADTNTQTALIKINGKVVAENIPFRTKSDKFNDLQIGAYYPADNCEFWFDDVEVHELVQDYADYVPEPVPLDTGKYILSMSVCNLWRNGCHYGWEYIAPHSEIQPITGYYDEGSPEAMDWEIKFLAEHGVSTYAMCWYAPTSPASAPIKKPRMIEAHHEGYFNAKYTEYLDFSIMWENASYGTPGTAEAFKENIFSHWMDWYFSDERYFRIEEDGKEYLFLTIYQWPGFRNMCLPAKAGAYSSNVNQYYSAAEFNEAEIAAAEIITWMEEQVIEAGYADGIILCFTNNGSSPTGNTSMLNMAGSDTAIFPYAWGNTAYNIETQKQMIETYYAKAQAATSTLKTASTGATANRGLDLLALAAVGFNDIGWAQRRYPLISDDDFLSLLQWFKSDYMPRYKYDPDQWKQYFIQFDTWNEYGEGHYIYPTVGLDPIPGTEYKGYGQYGYLEAMAKTFGTNYDEELHAELDITPTQVQKSRVGKLYVGNRMFIRREFLPTTMKETPIPDQKVVSLKFNSLEAGKQISGFAGFKLKSNNTYYTYNRTERAIELLTAPPAATQSNPDPIIHFDEDSAFNGINASECSILHIRMKTTLTGSPAQVFFRVDTMPKTQNSQGQYVTNYSEDYQYTFHLAEANEWHDYYIDLKSHEGFSGKVESIRFDPGNLEGNTIYLSDIEFLKFSDEQKRTEVKIDGFNYYPTDYWEIQSQGRDELYMAPADDNGFYKLMHIVYDWNENTGVLNLDTPDGTTFKFTVGSDEVVINGVEKQTLEKEFYVYDGCPVLPVIFILDNANYNYIYDSVGKKLDITVQNKVIFEDIPNGNAELEELTDVFFTQNDSTLSIVPDDEFADNNVWKVTGAANNDSCFLTDIQFENNVEYTLSFDIKLDSLEGADFMGQDYMVYLKTVYDDGTGVTERALPIRTVNYGAWDHVEFSFNIPETKVSNEEIREIMGIYIEQDWGFGVTYFVDNFKVIRQPKVFEYYNGDAEDEDMRMWHSSNSFITRVDDGTGNMVLNIEPDPESASAWPYIRQATTFENGVTYYFSFDFRMGKNINGDVIETSVALNARYTDLLQQHFTQNHSDHSVTYRDLSYDDGWKHFTGSFTVSNGRTNGGVYKDENGVWKDEITFYVNPPVVNGQYTPMSYQLDNIKFSTSPLE